MLSCLPGCEVRGLEIFIFQKGKGKNIDGSGLIRSLCPSFAHDRGKFGTDWFRRRCPAVSRDVHVPSPFVGVLVFATSRWIKMEIIIRSMERPPDVEPQLCLGISLLFLLWSLLENSRPRIHCIHWLFHCLYNHWPFMHSTGVHSKQLPFVAFWVCNMMHCPYNLVDATSGFRCPIQVHSSEGNKGRFYWPKGS